MNDQETIDYAKLGMDKNHLPKGLIVGSKVPDVDLIINGKTIPLSALYKKQKVALVFYRGYWCPFCSKFLSDFAKKATELENRGVKLLAVTSEKQTEIENSKEKTGANFTIIPDKDGSIQKAFDVRFKASEEYVQFVIKKLDVNLIDKSVDGTSELPVPATYLIDTTGTITYRHFDPNYKNRIQIDDIINTLK